MKCFVLLHFPPSYGADSFTVVFLLNVHIAYEKAAEECKDAIRTPSRPQFREKVMALLRTPYDQKEFNNLW